MKVSINRTDETVTLNGVTRAVTCASIHPNIHAVQWDADKKEGWIEFVRDPHDTCPLPNIKIVDMAPFRHAIEGWAIVLQEAYDNQLHDLMPAQQATAEAAASLAIARNGSAEEPIIKKLEEDWAKKKTAEDALSARLSEMKTAATAAMEQVKAVFPT